MSVSIATDSSGNPHIVAVGSGTRTGHLLYVTHSTTDTSGWSLIDVTAAIAQAHPTVPPYVVE